MDHCPTHHLPPETPITMLDTPTTAGLVCTLWHDVYNERAAELRIAGGDMTADEAAAVADTLGVAVPKRDSTP